MFVLAAPGAAMAQDPDSDLPIYPGPFDQETAETSETTDEVLGESIENLVMAEGDHHVGRSIDYIGDDAGSHFIAPDVQASSDPAAATGTGGGSAPGLANTGSDVEPILAMSAGLLAVGGAALVGSRRRVTDLFGKN